MKTAGDLLNDKGGDVWSIGPDASVYESIESMAEKGCGALAVMEGRDLVGIVSERDYARKVILKGKRSQTTLVNEVMSYPVICARPEFTIEETMALMTEKKVRHLPVVIETRVVGVISIGDVVRAIIADHEYHIEQLTHYITGG